MQGTRGSSHSPFLPEALPASEACCGGQTCKVLEATIKGEAQEAKMAATEPGGAEGKLKAEQHWERHDKVRRPCPLAAAVMGSV